MVKSQPPSPLSFRQAIREACQGVKGCVQFHSTVLAPGSMIFLQAIEESRSSPRRVKVCPRSRTNRTRLSVTMARTRSATSRGLNLLPTVAFGRRSGPVCGVRRTPVVLE